MAWALLVAGAGTATPFAAKAEAARIFRLPSEPVDSALLRFGVQAGVSVGGFPAPGCGGLSRPVLGVYTPAAALRRLLPAGCSFRQIDMRAFRIVAIPAQTIAESPGPTPPPAVVTPELVVTAEKRPEPLRGSPFAVSALDAQTLVRLGATSFAEAASQIAGVTETNLGPGRNKIFIRGISDGVFTGRTQSTVALYLDEAPITYSAPDPDLRLADVERVEVLRGPQGTLYGAGSIGGIVRIVTRAPDPRGFAAEVAGDVMINAHKDTSFGAEAMLNVPALAGRGAVRGVAYIDRLAGYLDNPALDRHDVNRGHRSGQRLAGLVDLPADWRIEAQFARQSIKSSDSQYVQGGGRLDRDARIAEPHDNDFLMFGVVLSRASSAVDLKMSAAYIDHDLATRYDATGAFDLAPGQVAAFDDEQRVELLVSEIVATSANESRLRWLAGAFASSNRMVSDARLDATAWGGSARSAYRRHDRLTEAAVFGEATYDLTPQLGATVGGRLFSTRVETFATGFDLAQTRLSPVRGRLIDSGFASKLRLSYAFAPDTVVYIQAQDGYRTGGFNVPAEADGTLGGPNAPTYRPDRLHSYEAGGEAALFDKSLTIRLAAYLAVWRDVQTDQFRPSGLPVTLNIGDGRNTGVELEARWRPSPHWRLNVSGLLNDPELTRSSDLFPARVDIGLPGVAKWMGAVDAGYGWEVGGGLRAEIAGQASYVGRSYLTFDGSSASAMGGYLQTRLSASLQSVDWRAEAYVDNVADVRGDTFAFGNPFNRQRSRQATPLAPRTFGLAIRRSF